jgi:hypothetical protein
MKAVMIHACGHCGKQQKRHTPESQSFQRQSGRTKQHREKVEIFE